MNEMTLKVPTTQVRASFLHGPPGLFAEQLFRLWDPRGRNSSHGISCNTLPAKLIQIGLDMNI